MRKPSADISVELVEALALARDELIKLGASDTVVAKVAAALKRHERGSEQTTCPVCAGEAQSRTVAGTRHVHCLDAACVSNGGWRSALPPRIAPPDYGPWTVSERTSASGQVSYSLQSEDFIFDAALALSGDFAEGHAKLYAEAMATWLNTSMNARLDVPALHVYAKDGRDLVSAKDIQEAVADDQLACSLLPVSARNALALYLAPPLRGTDTKGQERLLQEVHALTKNMEHAKGCQYWGLVGHKEDPERYCTCEIYQLNALKIRP